MFFLMIALLSAPNSSQSFSPTTVCDQLERELAELQAVDTSQMNPVEFLSHAHLVVTTQVAITSNGCSSSIVDNGQSTIIYCGTSGCLGHPVGG